MRTIQVTDKKLQELAKLSDWQLRDMGINPASVALAEAEIEDDLQRESQIVARESGIIRGGRRHVVRS